MDDELIRPDADSDWVGPKKPDDSTGAASLSGSPDPIEPAPPDETAPPANASSDDDLTQNLAQDHVADTPAADGVVSGTDPSPEAPTVIRSRSSAVADSDLVDAKRLPGTELVGTELGHYRLEELVGGGGMGSVYRGTDMELDRPVAVKVISAVANSKDALKRFKVEAQNAARLDHTNIARVYYVGETEDWNYIVFEYVDGENLRERVMRSGALPVEDVLLYAAQVSEALDHAWERNVVHRDIKPSNIVLQPDGNIKLVDMGLARFHHGDGSTDEITASEVILGTFDYISPEQAKNSRNVDVRSDLYSLGCTMYFLLTAAPPFPQDNALQKLLSHTGDAPPDPREICPGLDVAVTDLVHRLMAKDPERRFQTPREFTGQLIILSNDLAIPLGGRKTRIWVERRAVGNATWQVHLAWAVPAMLLLISVLVMHWTRASEPESWHYPTYLPAVATEDVAAKTDTNNDVADSTEGQPTGDEESESKDDGTGGPNSGGPNSGRPNSGRPNSAGSNSVGSNSVGSKSVGSKSVGSKSVGSKSVGPNGQRDDVRNPDVGTGDTDVNDDSDTSSADAGSVTEPAGDGESLDPPGQDDGATNVGDGDVDEGDSASSDDSTGGADRDKGTRNSEGPARDDSRNGEDESGIPSRVKSDPKDDPVTGAVERLVVVSDEPPLDEDAGLWRKDLVSAIRAANENAAISRIELRYDGPRVQQPARLANKQHLTIGAATGFSPSVLFQPDLDNVLGTKRMLELTGARVTWEDVPIRLTLPQLEPAEGWAIFALRGATSLDVTRSALTIENRDDSGIVWHYNVSAFLLAPDDMSRLRMPGDGERPKPARNQARPAIRLSATVVRGQANLLRMEEAAAFKLTWTDGLFASDQLMFDLNGAVDDREVNGAMEVDLTRVTARSAGGVARVNLAGRMFPVPLQLTLNFCIIISEPSIPLVEHRGVSDRDGVDRLLRMSGQRNAYPALWPEANNPPLRDRAAWSIHFSNSDSFSVSFADDDPSWKDFGPGTAVTWSNARPLDVPVHEHRAVDYQVERTDTNPAEQAGFADGVLVD